VERGLVDHPLAVDDQAVEVEDDRLEGHWCRAQSTRAATRPAMVCSAASMSTVRPWSRAVWEVMRPMHATTGGTASGPTTSSSRATVDDEVKVAMSAEAMARRCSSVLVAATVR